RVLGEHDEVDLRSTLALELAEVGLDEGAGQLAGTVGAEVHEDDGVAVFDFHRLADGGGLDEFIALVAGVGGLQAFDGAGGVELTLAVDDQVDRKSTRLNSSHVKI